MSARSLVIAFGHLGGFRVGVGGVEHLYCYSSITLGFSFSPAKSTLVRLREMGAN